MEFFFDFELVFFFEVFPLVDDGSGCVVCVGFGDVFCECEVGFY